MPIIYRCDACAKQAFPETKPVADGDALFVFDVKKPVGWIMVATKTFTLVTCSKTCADRRLVAVPEAIRPLVKRAIDS